VQATRGSVENLNLLQQRKGEIGYRANVRAFIKRIRQKFRDVDPEFTQIENYPGFGYRWSEGDGA